MASAARNEEPHAPPRYPAPVGLPLLALLALPLLAAAAPPARDFQGTVSDTFSEVVCGVPVTTTVQGAGTFTVFFDPKRAPVNHGIFGSNPVYTGELMAGEVTIVAPSTLPLLAGATPAP